MHSTQNASSMKALKKGKFWIGKFKNPLYVQCFKNTPISIPIINNCSCI